MATCCRVRHLVGQPSPRATDPGARVDQRFTLYRRAGHDGEAAAFRASQLVGTPPRPPLTDEDQRLAYTPYDRWYWMGSPAAWLGGQPAVRPESGN